MKNHILAFIFSLLALGCCKDSINQDTNAQLPPETQTGANTAGCYINGELLVPKNGTQDIGGSPSYGLTIGAGNNFNEPIVGDDYFFVRIVNLKDVGGDFVYLHINNMENGIGTYNIGQSNNEFFMDGPNNHQVIVQTFDGINLGKVFLSGPNAGTITITRFDYPNGIYSGTFSLTVYNKDNPSETIQITDGRFDIKVATLNH
jgi:hypothetical protein